MRQILGQDPGPIDKLKQRFGRERVVFERHPDRPNPIRTCLARRWKIARAPSIARLEVVGDPGARERHGDILTENLVEQRDDLRIGTEAETRPYSGSGSLQAAAELATPGFPQSAKKIMRARNGP